MDVFDHDDGVVHHEADGNRDGHERQIVEAVTEQIHDPDGAGQGQRHGDIGDERGPEAAQKQEDDHHDEGDADQQGKFHVMDRRADGGAAVVEHANFHAGRHPAFQLRQHGANAVESFDHIGPGLFLDDDQNGVIGPGPTTEHAVFHPFDRLTEGIEPERDVAALLEDDLLIGFGVGQLAVDDNGVRDLRAVEAADGEVHIRLAQQGADILQTDIGRGQRAGIHLHADGGFFGTADGGLADAIHLVQLLAEDFIGKFKNLGLRQGVGGEGQHHDGGIGRIHFAVGRGAGEVDGQVGGGGVDGGLDIVGGGLDFPVEVKLQGHVATAEGADGGHFRDAGNLAEATFQRSGERGGNGGGVGSGQRGRDHDHGKIHAGHGGHRHALEGNDPGQKQPERQQGGAGRTADEGRGNVHGKSAAGGGSSALAGVSPLASALARRQRLVRVARRSRYR